MSYRSALLVLFASAALVLAACQGDQPSNRPVTPTLQGAFVPTRVPSETPTPTETSTATATETPSATATETATATPTDTPSATATETPSATATETPSATATETPTATATDTATATATASATATDSASVVLTPTPELTRIVTVPLPPEVFTIPADAPVYEVEGVISNERFEQRYEFAAAQGEIIGVQMIAQIESGNLDPLIQLLDAEGRIIAENDDDPQGTGRDSYLREFRIPSSGIYTIRASRFQLDLGSTTGEYVLIFERGVVALATPRSVETEEPRGEDELLQSGDVILGTISAEQPFVDYPFEAEAGEVLNIQVNAIPDSGNLDAYVQILNEEGDVIAENDDDPLGTGRNSFLRDFVVPADGRYVVRATRFQLELGSTLGDFELIFESSAGAGPRPTRAPGVEGDLQFGQVVRGTISTQAFEVLYTFAGERDDIVDIRMRQVPGSGNLDAYLQLLDAEGRVIAENDDDPLGTGRDAFLREVRLPSSGLFTIRASRFQFELGTTTGEFELSLDLSGAPG